MSRLLHADNGQVTIVGFDQAGKRISRGTGGAFATRSAPGNFALRFAQNGKEALDVLAAEPDIGRKRSVRSACR